MNNSDTVNDNGDQNYNFYQSIDSNAQEGKEERPGKVEAANPDAT